MSTPAPAISVIVPAWGVAHLVGEALASLQAQSFADWEAIVVDDGAPDDVAGAVAPFAAADPRIRFLPTPHGGVSAARNRALAAARAPLIALLDGDDRLLPDYLAKMIAAISADPGLGLVSCDALYTGRPAREGRPFSHYSPQIGEPTLAAVIERRFNIFIAAMIRREAIGQAGGFDEALARSEDLDLWLRILSAGWRAAYVPEPLAIYRRRAGSLTTETLQLCRSTVQVYEKAARALAGRPEAALAAAMARRCEAQAAWIEGEDRVIAGEVRAGLDLLRAAHAERRSPRWRMMMPLFNAMPPIARPLLTWRRWREAQA
ncbi:MAG TPA: glycosyltransferase [Sphingomonas sp.]|nr:glycosyltransferase [Sphingomonas sp.]